MSTQHKSELHLPSWSEVVGVYGGLHTGDSYLYVKIGEKVLVFAKGSEEAETLLKKLVDSLLGCVVGVLKTDLQKEPVRVRIVKRRR